MEISNLITSMNDSSQFSTTFSAEHRIWRVRFVMYMSLLFFCLMQLLSCRLLPSWNSGVEANGEAISRLEVFALLAICQLSAWGFLVGMHVYGRCYVVLIYRSCAGADKVYETIGWLTRQRWFVTADDQQACKFHRGKTQGHYDAKTGITLMAVDAPYYSQKVAGRRLPFILDYDGIFFDTAEE